VISSANMHLNCDRRPEEQDVNALERFMKMVSRWETSSVLVLTNRRSMTANPAFLKDMRNRGL